MVLDGKETPGAKESDDDDNDVDADEEEGRNEDKDEDGDKNAQELFSDDSLAEGDASEKKEEDSIHGMRVTSGASSDKDLAASKYCKKPASTDATKDTWNAAALEVRALVLAPTASRPAGGTARSTATALADNGSLIEWPYLIFATDTRRADAKWRAALTAFRRM